MALSDIRTTTAIDRHGLPFHKHAQRVCLILQEAQAEIMADFAWRVVACNAPSCGAYMMQMQMISC